MTVTRSKAIGKILVVGSPHASSTRDVFMGVLKGLSQNNVSVQSYDVFPRGEFFANFITWFKAEKITVNMLREIPSPMLLAYEPVFLAAHHYEVDTVVFVSPQYLPMDIPRMLKKDGFNVVGIFTESPYEDHIDAVQKAEHFTTCFVSDLNSEAYWRPFNPRTHYLPHSFDPDKHFPAWDVPAGRKPRKQAPGPMSDMSGSTWNGINNHQHVGYVGSGFSRRQRYLEEMVRSEHWGPDIDLKLFGYWPFLMPSTNPEGMVRGPDGNEINRDEYFNEMIPKEPSPLVPYTRASMVDNAFTARIYRGLAIGINIHRTERWNNNADIVIDPGEAYSMGPRGVELAACGTFQLSDFRQEIVDVFGDSVPLHDSPEELGRLIRKYLNDPAERERLARLQHEAIKGRTFKNSMGRVLELAA